MYVLHYAIDARKLRTSVNKSNIIYADITYNTEINKELALSLRYVVC